MKKRNLQHMGIATFLAITLSCNTYAAILHKNTTEQIITRGAALIEEEVLTDKGWQDIYLLRVDLSDDNVTLKPIESNSLGERKNILDLANQTGAIAGVNADFFDMGTRNTPSFGTVIEEGKIKHGYNYFYSSLGPKKYMGSFLIDENNNPQMGYYGTSINLYAEGQKMTSLVAYNNIPNNLNKPILLDSSFYQNTAKIMSKFPTAVPVVLYNNAVTYYGNPGEVVTIPQDGYVVMMSEQDDLNYKNILPLGTFVEVKQELYLQNELVDSIETLQMGVGGGGLIMKDGSPYIGNSHKVSPATRAPRTVVATTYNPQEVLFITIDGRNKTLGANHNDLTDILTRYGVKDAMYFDGGGSTTLVAREEGDATVTIRNNPSDGSARKVANGVGVFTTSSTEEVTKLYLESVTDRGFVGEPIALKVKAVDANYNPVSLQQEDITFSVVGVNGSFDGLQFYPESSGKALVMASYNGIEAAKEIYISQLPTSIKIEPSHIQLSPNTSKQVKVYGVDRQGYKIPLSSSKINWTTDNQAITGIGDTISASSKGIATLTATYNDAVGKVGVVAGQTALPVESFENSIAKWSGSNNVTGKIEPSKQLKYHGNQALKMTYTFQKAKGAQIAYTIFENPIVIPKDAVAVNFWINAKNQGDAAKIVVVDAKGAFYYLQVSDKFDFEGWKYHSVKLPANIQLPAKVTKFYTYANDISQKRTSAVYLDHVSITRGIKNTEGITTAADYLFDGQYKESLQAPKNNQYMIHILGKGTADKDTLDAVGNKLSKNAKAVFIPKHLNNQLALTTNKHMYSNDFQTISYPGIEFITIGTDKGSIRLTSADTWIKMKQQIEASTQNNIVLMMSKNPLDEFADPREGQMLHNYLKEYKEATGKNIFVILEGNHTYEVQLEEGIRYITTSGFTNSNIKDATYLALKVVDNNVFYTFEKLN